MQGPRCCSEEWPAYSDRSGNEVRIRFYFSLLQQRMVSPATVVAATRSTTDSNLRCRDGEWFRLQNTTTPRLQRFRISWGKLGNRCKECPETTPLLQRFLNSWGKPGNHCRVLPGNALQCAVILDFRPRLGNHCRFLPGNAL